MIDIHCHILPDIDDGAKTLDDSITMAKTALSEGITTIIATPHHNHRYQNHGKTLGNKVDRLNETLQEKGCELKVLAGQEPRISLDLIEQTDCGEVLTLCDDNKYLHVELPSDHVPSYTKSVLFELIIKGIAPIIVHPERNMELIENPDLIYDLVEDGALTQVTAASLVGNFGKNIQKFSNELIEHNLTHFIASDAHNTSTRSFHLAEAYEKVEKSYGIHVRYALQENSEYLINGESVSVNLPVPIKRKKFLGLF